MSATPAASMLALYYHLEAVAKRNRLQSQRLLSRLDRWGLQMPLSILRAILTFVGASELATSQRVCSGWRLGKTVLDRSWEKLYRRHWETDGTQDHKAIAVA